MEKVLESGVEITVKNAEGDPDTKATIIHQNSIDYEPKVSVIIPVYNTEEYLRECLDSVVNQTLKEIEIICVDDGSTDSSLEILKEYAQKDNRFTIITQKNLHAGVARNAGLMVARGEYVHFLDSDDWVEKDIYIQAFADIKNNRIDVYLFNYNEYDLFNKKYKLKIPYVECKSIFNFEEYQIYLMGKPVVPWNKIYNKNFIEKNILKFDNTIVANDRTFYFKMLFSNPRMMKSTINKSMLNYRTNNTNSLVGIKRLDNFQIHFEVFDRCKNLCNKKSPKLMIHAIDLFMKDCLYFYNKATAKQKNIIKEQIKEYFYKNKNFFNKYEKDFKKKNWYDKYISIINSNIIPIVFATNEQYAKYINVVIESIIHNSSNKYFYQFYIFYSDLLDNTIESFKYLNNSNCHVTFVDLKNNINKTNPLYSRGRFSKEMWYRLYIPEVLKEYDKVIYLDCDIVVLKDISKLWEIDLGNNYLGACRNLVCGTGERLLKLGLNLNEYFNSGVLIFNNYLWNKYNLKEACIDILYKFQDLECPDQDILNLICQKHVKYIDLNWNFMWQYIILGTFNQLSENDKSLYRDAEKNISLIHYTTAIKPWIYPNYVYASYWYEYAKLCSCFKNSFLENIFSIKNEPIRNQHKIITILGLKLKIRKKDYGVNSFVENIFSVKNEHIRKQHKIITILGLKIKIKRKQAGGYSFAEKIFSVKNRESRDNKWHKVVCILGIKFRFRNKELTQRRQLQALEQRISQVGFSQDQQFKQINNKLNSTTQNIDKQIKETNSNIKNSIQGLNSALEQSNANMNNSIQNLNSLLESSNSSTSNAIQALENKIEQVNENLQESILRTEKLIAELNTKTSNSFKNIEEKFDKNLLELLKIIEAQREESAINANLTYQIKDNNQNLNKIIEEQKNRIFKLQSELGYINEWQQNFYKSMPQKYPIRLSEVEKKVIQDNINNSKMYLEFGSGGTTFLAVNSKKTKIVSIESDSNWIDYLISYNAISEAVKEKRLEIKHINIGKTKEWGYPVNDDLKENYPRYSSEIFEKVEKDKIDLVLIDGRFRVACALATIMNCKKSTKIMIHDYTFRQYYHILEEFLDIVETIDTLVVFKIKNNVDMKKVEELYNEYKYVKE